MLCMVIMTMEMRTEVLTLEGQFQFRGKSWGIIRELCLPSSTNITLDHRECSIALTKMRHVELLMNRI